MTLSIFEGDSRIAKYTHLPVKPREHLSPVVARCLAVLVEAGLSLADAAETAAEVVYAVDQQAMAASRRARRETRVQPPAASAPANSDPEAGS